MKEYKIRTHGNETLSRAIQDELFKLGYGWLHSETSQENPYYPTPLVNLKVYKNGHIAGNWHGAYVESNFNNCGLEEVTINDLISLRIEHEYRQKQEAILEKRKQIEVLEEEIRGLE